MHRTHAFVVVGSGILGLALVEYLSRPGLATGQIVVVSNENPMAGSYAAAANLATKGQLFARDPHFALKLEAKARYSPWLQRLADEIGARLTDVLPYKMGQGIDRFEETSDFQKQWQRVKQPDAELMARGLPIDAIAALSDGRLSYQSEAWVCARSLLSVLRTVCERRGVAFVRAGAEDPQIWNLIQETWGPIDHVCLCAGAWTSGLLSAWGLQCPPEMARAQRLSVGSTWVLPLPYSGDSQAVLVEFVTGDRRIKVTMSGDELRSFLSSTTLRVAAGQLSREEEGELDELNRRFIAAAHRGFPALAECATPLWEKRTGFRVGFGHAELVMARLDLPCSLVQGGACLQHQGVRDWALGGILHPQVKISVCTGAHKSGFLFAAVMGEAVHKLHFCQ